MAQQMVVRFGTHFAIRLGEWLSSTILASLSVLLVVQPTVFDRTPDYFAPMTSLTSQSGWAIIFGVCGFVHMGALYVNGRRPITPYIRMVLSFISCFVWWQVTISLYASGVPGLGWAVFPWLLALEMYNVFRSSADAREVFDTKRAARNGTKALS